MSDLTAAAGHISNRNGVRLKLWPWASYAGAYSGRIWRTRQPSVEPIERNGGRKAYRN